MKSFSALCLFLLSLLSPVDAGADPFTILPDGSLVFNVALTTQGTFRCSSFVPCSGSGTSSITLGSGANTATMTFTGVNNSTFQVGNVSTPVTIGRFESSATSGFVFPSRRNENDPVLLFDLVMTHTSPVDGRNTPTWSFGPGGGAELPVLSSMGATYSVFLTGPNPPGFRYTQIVYTFSPFPFSLPSNGAMDLGAQVGAVPEPATLVLLGTGLAGVAYSRRRKRRSESIQGA